MNYRQSSIRVPRALATVALVVLFAIEPLVGQEKAYVAPRTSDGRPDLNGIWQALGSATGTSSPTQRGSVPSSSWRPWALSGGLGIVEGGEIPYTEEARAQQQENLQYWLERDPAVKCYMPGVPRATYMPYPFQLVQTPEYVLLAYEFASASRIVYMDRPDFVARVDAWMGHNIGRWEGETLVIDVTAQVPNTWFDSSGNHHSNQMHVEERYTAISPNHLMYEATITDPETYTRPWTIKLPLYRRIDKNMQLLEFKVRRVRRGADVRAPAEGPRPDPGVPSHWPWLRPDDRAQAADRRGYRRSSCWRPRPEATARGDCVARCGSANRRGNGSARGTNGG